MTGSYLKEGKREFRGKRDIRGSRPSERTYDVRLKYRYHANGGDFTGDARALRQPKTDNRWDEAHAVADSYVAGEKLAVFYKPGNASASRLTRKEPGIEFGKDVFVTLLFLSAGIGAMSGGRTILRRDRHTAPS